MLRADLRDPTPEELANPWVEGVDAGRTDMAEGPGGAIISGVRADDLDATIAAIEGAVAEEEP